MRFWNVRVTWQAGMERCNNSVGIVSQAVNVVADNARQAVMAALDVSGVQTACHPVETDEVGMGL
jgi:hypothetical protein